MTILSSLTSGLIGALIGSIIGAIATYKAAIKGAKVSIEESVKIDIKQHRYETNTLKKQVINHLISEANDNLKLSENIKIGHAKIRFLNEAYEMAKLHAQVLPIATLEMLRPAYVEVIKYNALADYDQAKVSYGGGYLDNALIKQAELVRNKFSELPKKLQGFLKG